MHWIQFAFRNAFDKCRAVVSRRKCEGRAIYMVKRVSLAWGEKYWNVFCRPKLGWLPCTCIKMLLSANAY